MFDKQLLGFDEKNICREVIKGFNLSQRGMIFTIEIQVKCSCKGGILSSFLALMGAIGAQDL